MRGNSGVDNWARGRILSLAGTQRFPLVVAGVDVLVSPALPADFTVLSDMLGFVFESNAANTGPVTLDIGDGVARTVTHIGGAALIAGDIPGADTVVEVFYDVSSDTFHAQLIRQPSSVAGAKLSGAAGVGVSTRYARADHQHGSAIIGVTDGSSALAGDVGEYIEQITLVGAAVALVNNTPVNIASINLSAGDWDIHGCAVFLTDGATDFTSLNASLNNVSATINAYNADTLRYPAGSPIGIANISRGLSTLNIKSNVPFSVYLVANCLFSAGTLKGYGEISATRVR